MFGWLIAAGVYLGRLVFESIVRLLVLAGLLVLLVWGCSYLGQPS